MGFSHTPVLLRQSIHGLAIQPHGIYVDGTTGGAGHAVEIAKQLKTGKLYALDQDPDAVKKAQQSLDPYVRAKVIQCDFSDLKAVLAQENVKQINGLLLDLGVSSHQLDTAERGFSYHMQAKLDMRMSQTGISAFDIVNQWNEEQLKVILWEYGEERYAYQIVKNILKAREKQPIETTTQLAELVACSMPARARRQKNPAKQTFQAIRIAVNGELEKLSKTMNDAFSLLSSGGRMAIITFHSLEDRMVKQRYSSWCKGCICPADFPQCVCGKLPRANFISRKPIIADQQEIENNRRSRTAKLRIIEKI